MKKMYIGPTIEGIAVRNTVYDVLPKPLRKAMRKYPYLSGLCVNIIAASVAMQQIETGCGSAYELYCRALKNSAEIKKGVI